MGVKLTRVNGAAIVTLDWPSRRNALGPEQGAELAGCLEALAANDDVSVVVLTGNGAFCGGGDLTAINRLVDQGEDAIRSALYQVFHRLVRSLVWMPVPVLAAVDGPAIGLGMDLALACDWRAIGPNGWFRQGWGEYAVIPGLGGEFLLRRLAPNLVWSLLGETNQLGPDAAERFGLAAIALDSALVMALARAESLERLPRSTLQAYVRLHRDEFRTQLERHLEMCLDVQVSLLCSDDYRSRAARFDSDRNGA